MFNDELIGQFISRLPQLIVKIFTVSMMVFHLLFAIIVFRQTRVMSKVVEAKISPSLVFITVIHLLSSLFVLGWVILFL
ncbi:MAG: hypothetical protein UV73_C0015G0022 [Candidatus Gottesmanbacteria bacterium GW2011_GWA2_43_14]|uniref:Uncharacterized protein n=1 Tax=Candidatus Gottesmanbacteria bacterium GW2011_GWA2_43_14 TaxID=1618443 RepID=A0A0G1DDI2_9BACT|nr:MAG: hypothetical protein UV73_C0015G0022 [Candidatus Gottesmanbacteria bacterium GW2011_GWA2_43_14]